LRECLRRIFSSSRSFSLSSSPPRTPPSGDPVRRPGSLQARCLSENRLGGAWGSPESPKRDPRKPQEGSKKPRKGPETAPRSLWITWRRFWSVVSRWPGDLSGPSWSPLGALLGRSWGLCGRYQAVLKRAPKKLHEGPERAPRSLQVTRRRFWSVCGWPGDASRPSWNPLGACCCLAPWPPVRGSSEGVPGSPRSGAQGAPLLRGPGQSPLRNPGFEDVSTNSLNGPLTGP